MGRGYRQRSGLPNQVIRPGQRSGASGFTLVELMVIVVIVAILAATAIPMYSKYALRANRSAVESVMLDMASAEERYMIDNRAYSTANSDLGYASLPSGVSPFYTVVVTTSAGPPPGYQIVATPISTSTQARDTTCGTLTLKSDGSKSPGGTTGCWK